MLKDIEDRLDLLDLIVLLLDERNHSWSVSDAVTRSNVIDQLKTVLNGYESLYKKDSILNDTLSQRERELGELRNYVDYLEKQLDGRVTE